MLFRNLCMRMAPKDDETSGGGDGDKDKTKTDLEDQEKGKKGGPPEEPEPEEGDALDLSALPEAAQKLIKKLRGENAKTRQAKNNASTEAERLKSALKKLTGDETDADPEKLAEALAASNEKLQVRHAMLELALEHGVGKDQREYFEFLVGKAIEGLEEGAELDEDAVLEIATRAKANSSKGPANSSTAGDKQQTKNNGGKPNAITPEQFAKMGMTERTKLFREDKDEYDRLMAATN